MRTPRLRHICACLISLFVLSASTLLAQSTGGRFTGKVTDASGAVLPGVAVTLTNDASGVARATTTNSDGDYSFPETPVGTYHLEFDLAGFKKNLQPNVILQLNQVLTVNETLQIGERKDVVEVTTEAPIVDTTSTQLGAVINDRSIAQLPLNARNTYQFLSLQPGVQSTVGADLYYGSSDAGSVSVNGGRGRANNFSVNGGDANDLFVNTPTINPSPDAVEEFRVLTNSFDAEFGRNSGSVINVVTKSGGNNFHGDAYDFLRNKVLNSKNYFDLTKSKYIQNQFGATLGGPIRKDKTFFFASFEGNRIRKGISGGDVTVPSDLERTGDFSAGSTFAGSLQDQFVADILNNRGTGGTGCANAIATAGGGAPAAGANWSDIFPGNKIPSECQDPVAVDLMQQFVPNANVGSNTFLTAITGSSTVNQGTVKFDHRISDKQSFSAYYYVQDQTGFDPYNVFQAAGANVAGFGGNNATRDQQINLSHTWTISNTLVNEARVVYMREGQRTLNHPQKTNLVVDSCTPSTPAATSCFTGVTDAPGAFTANGLSTNDPKYGITPGLGAGREGVPDINVSGGFVIGNNFEGELPQVGNSFQFTDGMTLVKGSHTIKFGGDVRRMRFDQFLYFETNGYYQYFGGGPNDLVSDNLFPNYLLGLPDQYQQGAAQQEHIRTSSFYLFAQDSWKLAKHLTLNYGLRWELNTPQKDIGRRVQTFRPGQISSRYPCLSTAVNDCASAFPTGLVYPGDPGVPAGLTTTYNKAFAPRLGIAWDPKGDGKTSVRAGWGLFYNPIEQLVLEQFSAEPPFGISLTTFNTLFNTPYVSQGGGVLANGANGVLDPKPGTAVDWSLYEPILLFGEFQPHMRTQYAAQYNLTIQREIARGTQLQLGYVGSQSHRLLASYDINRASPETCLALNSILGDGTCGPYGEDSTYVIPAGTTLNVNLPLPYGSQKSIASGTTLTNDLTLVGLRPYSSPNCEPTTGAGCPTSGAPVFSNIFAENTIGASNYNSFQASLDKRFGKGFQTQIAYTWSKSIDQASSFEDFLDTTNPRRTRALSLFDARHRLVASYYWEIPVPKYSGVAGKLLNGWALSGITQFQSGFPIRIFSYGDENLIGNAAGFSSPTFPDLVGKFHRIDPKTNGGYYFQPLQEIQDPTQMNPNSQFAAQAPGTQGSSPRTVCCGPGLDNTDFSIQKNTSINERFRAEFRVDIFNAFNHTKFTNPDGIFSDGSDFGLIKKAADPRLMQVALKLYF